MRSIFLLAATCIAIGGAYAQSTNEKQKEQPDSLKKELKEVTVEGNNIVTTPDKMMIFVDKSIKNHSYDGYSALALLNVPGLNVDAIDGKISALSGGVLVCINGLEATHNEIKTLNPKDIIRIDYYTNFDPRHPGQKNVLDYIMKIRDYGGMVMLQSTQSLNIATGVEVADWKMYNKKAEFGVNVVYNYMHFKQNTGNVKSRAMMFDDGDVTRTAYMLPTRNHNNAYEFTLSHIQRFKNSTLKTAVNLSPSKSKGNGESRVEYTGLTELEQNAIDNNTREQLVPSFTIRYNQKIRRGKSTGSLNAFLGGSYFNTDVTRQYYGLDNIDARTKGNGLSINPGLSVSLPFGRIFTPYVSASYFYTNTRSRYFENNTVARNHYAYQSANLSLGTNMRLSQRLSISASLNERMSAQNTGSGYDREYTLTPMLDVSYETPKHGNIYFNAYTYKNVPNSGYATTIERRKDEFLITAGNPNLKFSNITNLTFSYTLSKKWGWMQVYSNYNNTSHAIYTDYICDDDRDVFIQTYKNGRNYEQYRLNFGIEYKIVPNMANISAGTTYVYTAARTFQFQRLNRLNWMLRANFFKKGFVGNLEFRGPSRDLSRSGEYIKKPVSMNIDLGYNYKGWSFNFMTRNPFMKTYSETILNL
ncbi:MAG: outer membrane beta-barrel protein, partial [Muribaculum sp.]|nr:outer membrane beta-barrel protein [Muribaculum sp.]